MVEIGSTDNFYGIESGMLEETETKISDLFKLEPCEIPNMHKEAFAIGEYEYDFGDSWIHHVG